MWQSEQSERLACIAVEGSRDPPVHSFNIPQVCFNLFSRSGVKYLCCFQYGYKGHTK